ncbi:MAG: hypothetical protein N2449_02575, partial [Bacteroidales bacterium]|nr:hypothetical protein [Bacteroidales bacterium]
LIIRRCMIVGALVLNGNRTTPSLYNTIEQNVILNYVDLSNTKQLILRNNIFQDRVYHAYEALISNNIFLRSPHVPWIGGVPLFNVDNSIISNNVFYSVSPNYGNVVFHYCENNTIQNNLFITTPNYTSNIAMGNFHDVAQSSIFVNCTSDNFNYSFNYHLQSPTTYLGTDGTQVGIYGGSVPWKEGSVPKIPHIIEKNIAPQTDSNGMLQIQIKVAAQNE